MANAVITIDFDDLKKISRITFPIMEEYAKKIGADFIVIKQEELRTLAKFHMYYMFIRHNRIIYFNPNILIRDDCPDLFELVSEKKIGLFNEGAYQPKFESMYLYCKTTNEILDEKKWKNEFYNLGVIVASRIHKELFKPPKEIVDTPLYDQACITLRIINSDVSVHDLDYKLNRLPFLDTLVGQARLDSYILQYDMPNVSQIYNVMLMDLDIWSKTRPEYKFKKRILFRVGGGMGDQLCAEPVIRYAIENIYNDAEINIITNWPELFSHLTEFDVNIYKDDSVLKSNTTSETPVRLLETMPDPKSEIWRVIPHTICHGVDFCSMASIHRILPDDCKQFKLSLNLDSVVEVMDLLGSDGAKDYVLVHPGKGWDSKTFPEKWWNKVIQDLYDKGLKVIIIGKYISEKQGYVDVDIPEGVLDLRDLLSNQAMFLLIGQAPVLISNDSAPIHIGGAFDNWIILIPTCKHPDNVLPYRNGSKSYKTKSLYKKLTVDYIDSSPTRLSSQTLDWVEGDILDYLPETEDVVDCVVTLMNKIKKEEDEKNKIIMDKDCVNCNIINCKCEYEEECSSNTCCTKCEEA